MNDGTERWERDRKRLSEVNHGHHKNTQQILFLLILVCLSVCRNALNDTTEIWERERKRLSEVICVVTL